MHLKSYFPFILILNSILIHIYQQIEEAWGYEGNSAVERVVALSNQLLLCSFYLMWGNRAVGSSSWYLSTRINIISLKPHVEA